MNSFPEMNLWVVGRAEGSKERDVGVGGGGEEAGSRERGSGSSAWLGSVDGALTSLLILGF